MTVNGQKKEAGVVMLNWLYEKNANFVEQNKPMLAENHLGEHVFIVAGRIVESKRIATGAGIDVGASINAMKLKLKDKIKEELVKQENFAKLVNSMQVQFLEECRSAKVAATFGKLDVTHITDILSRSMVVYHVEDVRNKELIRLEQQNPDIRKEQ